MAVMTADFPINQAEGIGGIKNFPLCAICLPGEMDDIAASLMSNDPIGGIWQFLFN